MYVLDANIFIQSNRSHYGLDIAPGFWDWIDRGHRDQVLLSIGPVGSEIAAGHDDLTTWAASRRNIFAPMDGACAGSLALLANWVVRAPVGFTQAAQNVFLDSADYQLIAYAHAHSHTVVTYERSAPDSKKRVKIPDACLAVGVPCIDPFTMMRNETVQLRL